MQVNGDNIHLEAPQTLEEFLEAQGYSCARVVTERNGVIVPRESVGEVTLTEDDVLEIITFMGGG